MHLDLEYLREKFIPYFEGEHWERLSEFFETVEFKHHKSIYHLDNIKEKILKSTNFEQEDYYEKIYFTLYYELESFLIAVRSTVDILMHIINESLKLGIGTYETNLGTVYRSTKLPVRVKNMLHKYSHNRNNQIWEFIYQYRNEVVHEKSVNQLLPVTIDFFIGPEVQAFMDISGERKNVALFLDSCIVFIQRFITHLFEALAVSLEREEV